MAVAAGYVRVSTVGQNATMQMDAIRAWQRAKEVEIRWFSDKQSGATMDRPAWARLEAAIAAGEVDTVVVWRLDRLGRTAAGLTALFENFRARGVRFVSLTEGMDLGTATGRMVAGVLASIAEFEREVRSERQMAGIAAARKRHGGRCPWGGSVAGKAKRLTAEQISTIKKLHAEGGKVASIARAVGTSRPTVYTVIKGQVSAK